MSEQITQYGGQAVIEGVMFGGIHSQVTAVRRQNGTIETYEVSKKQISWVDTLKKIPILRGIVALTESSATGAKHLQFASDKFAEDEEGEPISKSQSSWALYLGVAVIGVISLIIGKMIFTALPAFLASIIFDPYVKNLIIQNLLEGAIKTILLLAYLLILVQTPMIKRLFQYHGAEHKVINAYEARLELTVENVQKQSTLHYRCGSSFMILTIIVGVFVYSFFSYDSVWERIWIRLLLLPLVIGLSYELLRITNAVREVRLLKYLGYPGLWLQKLTTRQPNDDQVEVAIAAFQRMHELDQQSENVTSQVAQPC
ncbi:Uncharacterized conserved protein YqhQ [Seinonella peptonophila]|uniref:Uncharacterized conserved protein YqhQ n=1 Tax=Seinonella peptonophila TaxID=112248 RepID=A0A1M4TNW6_9BACL|nr:DUF1385 domain-containing protein [Seinonella peptonophila]SHE46066.1 Uncharacterized conserved protein YqhQ [Seinonella peptonophila]